MAGTITNDVRAQAEPAREDEQLTEPVLRRAPRFGPEAITSFVMVAAAVVFTIGQLEPGLLLTATTPAGGDMGAHVWGPAYLRDTLLPQGKLAGWTPDWYAGFPAYQFYMVVPSLLIVALDVLLPYGVAFKLVTVLGVATLPIAAWALGRLARLAFPGPPLLAVAAVGFLFDRSFSIYGGNIASTLAGEFAFSLSLSLAVLYLGVLLRGLETGRHRVVGAVLLALCALCHIIPAIFAVVATAVALVLRADRGRLRWVLTTGLVGSALTAFWTVPFVLRRAYLNDMGWEKKHELLEGLLPGRIGESLTKALGGAGTADVPGDITLVAILAVVGVGVSLAYRRRLGTFLTVLAAIAALGYVLAPQGRLWNARLLPFWYLSLYLLAAIAIAELAVAFATLVARDPQRPPPLPRLLVGVGAGVVALIAIALPLRSLPLGEVELRPDGTATGVYSWGPISTGDRSYVPDWARWNYSGYERKAKYPEYKALIDTMASVGATEGCGRAMWEYHPDLDAYGTPMAPMLLPYWTDGCIGSMEGLFFEASATTPYHFINQSELSTTPSRAQRDLPYGPLDVELGVDHLQMLGVRYYLTYTAEAAAQADTEPDLTYLTGTGPWKVYEVADSELVAPLEAVPAVVEGAAAGGERWLEPSVEWYVDPQRWDVALAADGPDAWERVSAGEEPERRSAPVTEVSAIDSGDDWISFSVEHVGVPMVVKASYFPNWGVEGAEGPYRIAPNLMVVVPTDTDVRLTYGTTGVEWLGWTVTLLGIAGLILFVRQGPLALAPARVRVSRRRRDLAEADFDDPLGAPGSDGAPATYGDGVTGSDAAPDHLAAGDRPDDLAPRDRAPDDPTPDDQADVLAAGDRPDDLAPRDRAPDDPTPDDQADVLAPGDRAEPPRR